MLNVSELNANFGQEQPFAAEGTWVTRAAERAFLTRADDK